MHRRSRTLRFFLLVMLLAGLLLVLAGRAAVQVTNAVNSAPGPVDIALDHFRNLEHDLAEKKLEDWLAEHPSDLRALNYLASVILQREMIRRELLESQVYGPKGEAFPPGKIPLSPGFQQQLFGILSKAESLAETRLKQNPRDEEALYWAGVAHVTRAIFQLSLARSNLAALGEAKEARRFHAQLLALNPNYIDALMVVGVYDYVVGRLPWYMKVLASIAGHHGDKERGLEEIKRVTVEGHWAREDAKWFLAILYFGEKRYSEAIGLLQGLSQSYPRNYLLPQEIARAYKSQGDLRAAVQIYDTMLAKYDARAPGYGAMPVAKILYQGGQVDAQLGEIEEALGLFERAANRDENNIFVYRAEFEGAGICLRLNRRDEARQKYARVVQAIPNTDEGKSARQTLRRLQETRPAAPQRAK